MYKINRSGRRSYTNADVWISKLKQETNEAINEFHTRLQIASKYCQFGENKEKEIKAPFELETISKKLRRHSFRTPAVTLLDYVRANTSWNWKTEGSKRKPNSHVATLKMMSIKFNVDNHDTQSYVPDNARLPQLQNNVFVVDMHAWPHSIGSKYPAEGQQCCNCS